jgi:gliding motility-associated-like protein
MKRYILLFFPFFSFVSVFAQQYVVGGGSGTPVLARSANKMEIWLLYGMNGAQISYTTPSSTERHQWYRYATKANEAVPIESTQTGTTSVVTDIQEGYGYFVGATNDPATAYVWIIDYSKYLPVFRSLNVNEDNDKCSKLRLDVNADVPALKYYTSTGVLSTLTRKFTLFYTTLEWLSESLVFAPKEESKVVENLSVIEVNAPLKDTDFVLSGDEYAEHFGVGKTISTPVYQAVAVEAHGVDIRDKEKAPNEFEEQGAGSAPIHITFNGYANDPVSGMYIWKISKLDKNGNWISVVRYPDKNMSYSFVEDGDFRIDLEVIDRKSVCVDSSQTFSVKIGDTEIKVPKAFSPGSSPGANDEFRISYTSVINFKCTIFNRWGTKLYEWNDPAKGWDGRVNGRFVPTGVYFYIIQYKGTNGKNKTKKGSVNVLRSKY